MWPALPSQPAQQTRSGCRPSPQGPPLPRTASSATWTRPLPPLLKASASFAEVLQAPPRTPRPLPSCPHSQACFSPSSHRLTSCLFHLFTSFSGARTVRGLGCLSSVEAVSPATRKSLSFRPSLPFAESTIRHDGPTSALQAGFQGHTAQLKNRKASPLHPSHAHLHAPRARPTA